MNDTTVSTTLRALTSSAGRLLSERLRPLDLTVPQFEFLTVLAADPSLNGAAVAKAAHVSAQTGTTILHNLAIKQLIPSNASAALDRRRHLADRGCGGRGGGGMNATAVLPRRIDRRVHALGTDTASFSGDRVYRYTLTRTWGEEPPAVWIMLNPSTADAFTEDATIRRVINFTRRLAPEAGGLTVVNLYSLRATDPAELWTHPDPVGPAGDYYLGSRAISGALNGRLVIAAWGMHGARNGRGAQVATELTAAGVKLWCLGVTKDGHPKHPLYLAGDTPLVPYAGWGRS